jgi:hypothetical protein
LGVVLHPALLLFLNQKKGLTQAERKGKERQVSGTVREVQSTRRTDAVFLDRTKTYI